MKSLRRRETACLRKTQGLMSRKRSSWRRDSEAMRQEADGKGMRCWSMSKKQAPHLDFSISELHWVRILEGLYLWTM